ncbi:MAG: hypothetical protein LM550_10305 [Candidatus Contendobacter sp.]|jgi:hypothetical protein|nr:hypothetical protein [Gammaproteobacteria bacterium]MCC8994056.1 hypothetical protein [Candidatus Contendobacter sp.]
MPVDEKRRQEKPAKKVAERKAKLAEKRSRVPSGPTVAARFPVGDCLVSINLFDEGIVHLILARLLPHVWSAGASQCLPGTRGDRPGCGDFR